MDRPNGGLYGSSGELLKVLYLPPDREILRLAIDDNDTIWTIGAGTGYKDPGTVPLIIKYNTVGDVVGEFIRRTEFPTDAAITKEGRGIGAVSFGIATERVWFFLPSSHRLVTIRKDGTDLKVTDVGVPPWPDAGNPNGEKTIEIYPTFWTPSSANLIAQVFFGSKTTSPRRELYQWSSASRAWRRLTSNEISLHFGSLKGVEEDGMIVAIRMPSRSNPVLELARLPLPQN